ncbi:DUF3159 domain-containing protein [Lacisediminihabitans sp. G11-30]|uniref:DUF3159 domain-containing protein n=2 Tax=Lacisediminihabitans changchengi TaxID=2787634 RepID=A0A934SHI7_9MICO|nr:DUF3159 domain-containing protein [Lacisediminihabitans changchengi]MBK4348146.1 DUF3159 domain-containing protein [Lacisediminihabitans changchengi]
MAAAMRKTGFGQVTPGEVPTAGSLLSAVGGVRGLIESILPGLVFLVLYTITKSVPLAVLVPVIVGAAFIVVRLVTRSPVMSAVIGLLLLAVSAVLALISGRAEQAFIPGMVINASSVLVLLISIIVGWPLIGLIVGFLTNEGVEWKKDAAKRRVLYIATWMWLGLFALRLAVEVPLYLARQTEWLAGTKLVLGVPLYAVLLWVTWLLVRAAYGRAAVVARD